VFKITVFSAAKFRISDLEKCYTGFFSATGRVAPLERVMFAAASVSGARVFCVPRALRRFRTLQVCI
jgi:hypothetical protein